MLEELTNATPGGARRRTRLTPTGSILAQHVWDPANRIALSVNSENKQLYACKFCPYSTTRKSKQRSLHLLLARNVSPPTSSPALREMFRHPHRHPLCAKYFASMGRTARNIPTTQLTHSTIVMASLESGRRGAVSRETALRGREGGRLRGDVLV